MPEHMHNVDLESNFQDFENGHMLDHEEVQYIVGTLFEGMHFETKEEFQHALQWYHMIKGANFNTKLSNSTKLFVKCEDDRCAWRCRAT